jgi:hypothetical protein
MRQLYRGHSLDKAHSLERKGANEHANPLLSLRPFGSLPLSRINSVLQRATTASVQEINNLIMELQGLRDTLDSERARVQREIVQYSTLTRGALHSTKVIAGSLTQFKKAPETPSLSLADLRDRSIAS